MKKTLKNCLSIFVFFVATQCLAAGTALTQPQNGFDFRYTEAVLPGELENERGRGGFDLTAMNNANLQATLTGNAANNNVTGVNIIDNGAFREASGMFSIIQNSGNNVIIQDSTNINVTILP